jgi:radical SAM superfamily enzyme YgiQ (UPF0313 family)
MDGKYLTRNAESVVEEIRCSTEDAEMISFDDDNTLHDVRRARLLSDLLKQSRIRKKLSMYARADDVVKHPDLIENLRDVGLECLTLGIESFRDDDLHQLNKKTSVLINNEAIRILHKLGVHISAHFIVSPDYTAEDFERLFRYVCDQNLRRPLQERLFLWMILPGQMEGNGFVFRGIQRPSRGVLRQDFFSRAGFRPRLRMASVLENEK